MCFVDWGCGVVCACCVGLNVFVCFVCDVLRDVVWCGVCVLVFVRVVSTCVYCVVLYVLLLVGCLCVCFCV